LRLPITAPLSLLLLTIVLLLPLRCVHLPYVGKCNGCNAFGLDKQKMQHNTTANLKPA
jgi:hypothetical protein